MAELEALQTVHAQLEELGAKVFAVSPQLPEHSRRMEKRLKLDFPILFDEGNQTAAEWGLTFDFSDELRAVYEGFGLDLPAHHGTGGWTLPMPARFVIAAGGLLHQAEVHPDYTKRPEPESTVEIVRGLTQ